MKVIYVTDDTKRINLGFRGENEVRNIVFDLTDLISDYGNGTAVLLAKRSQDISAYPVSDIVQEGTTLTWTVNQEVDSAYAGNGQAEIFWYLEDEALAKTKVYPTYCTMDIGVPNPTPPDPYQTWIDTLTELGAETLANAEAAQEAQTGAETAQGKAEEAQGKAETAQEKAEAAQEKAEAAQGKAETAQGKAEAAQAQAEEAVTHYPKIVSDYWYVWQNGTWVNTNVRAEAISVSEMSIAKTSTSGLVDTYTITVTYTDGNSNTLVFTVTNGEDGYSPVVAIESIEGGHRVTITDEEHPTGQSFDVMDGEVSEEQLMSVYPVENGGEGSIISFDDGADGALLKSMSIDINPVQDLHGYDNPWPAGGGKNKVSVSSLAVGGTEPRTKTINIDPIPAGTYYVSFTSSGTATSNCGVQFLYTGGGNVAITTASILSGGASITLTGEVNKLYPYIGQTEYGNGQTMVLTNLQVESGSTKTSYAPYSNICPISGWTGANIDVVGRNWLGVNSFTNGIRDDNGNVTASSNSHFSNAFKVLPNTQYTINGNLSDTTSAYRLYFLKADGTWIQRTGTLNQNTYTFTTPSDCGQMQIQVSVSRDLSNCQLELGSTAPTYSPYNGTTYTVSWQTEAGTVYSGKLNVLTGKLVVDRAFKTYNGSETWSQGTGRFATTISDAVNVAARTEVLSNLGVFRSSGSAVGTIFLYNGDLLYYAPTNITTLDAFKTWLSTNNLQVVYPLATALEYTLSEAEVRSILGENNIWADTGDSELVYRADIQTYISKYVSANTPVMTIGTIATGNTPTATITGTTLAPVLNITFPATDNALSPTSTNPVQNAVVTTEKADIIADTASGSIASFPDGTNYPVKALEIGIDPVQDLHGYENPWPAGGGKNKASVEFSEGTVGGIALTKISSGVYKINGSNTSGATSARIVNLPAPLPAGQYTISANNDKVATSGSAYLGFKTSGGQDPSVTLGATGSINGTKTVTANTEITQIFLSVLNGCTIDNMTIKFQIETGGTATTFAPPENICPISGRTGAEIYHTSKNLAKVLAPNTSSSNGITFEVQDESKLVVTGTATGNASSIIPASTRIYPAGTYTAICRKFKGSTANDRFVINGRTVSDNTLVVDARISGNVGATPDGTGRAYTFTVTEPITIGFFVYINSGTVTNFTAEIEIEKGSTVGDYVPPTPTTITENWQSAAGTVYGGSLNVLTGVLTATHEKVNVSQLNTYVHTTGSINKLWLGVTPHKYKGTGSGQKAPFLTSSYSIGLNSATGGLSSAIDTLAVACRGVNTTNETDTVYFIDKIANTPSGDFVYELATPVTYQLTPTQVSTLLGENNIWADTGEVSVTYRADTQRYIQKLTGSTEEDMIANVNIAANKYFMVGGNLYYSTASIASGETIVVGTNCTATNLADALNALNS